MRSNKKGKSLGRESGFCKLKIITLCSLWMGSKVVCVFLGPSVDLAGEIWSGAGFPWAGEERAPEDWGLRWHAE